MTNNQTLELLADPAVNRDTVLEFHLTSRHYPPVQADFFPAIRHAIALANASNWDATLGLPNGRVLSVSAIIEQLHLEPFLADNSADWDPIDSYVETLCAECSDTGADERGEVTHCTRCGARVWE